MNPPIEKGKRVVVNGNLQPYALAVVVETIFVEKEARWAIVLEWPNAPGGPSFSRVYEKDENKGWYRYELAS